MNKQTLAIKQKGWTVKEALSRWGRSWDWYSRQVNGTELMKTRLDDMIAGLPVADILKGEEE